MDMDSKPPATEMVEWPSMIDWAANMTDFIPDAHTCGILIEVQNFFRAAKEKRETVSKRRSEWGPC